MCLVPQYYSSVSCAKKIPMLHTLKRILTIFDTLCNMTLSLTYFCITWVCLFFNDRRVNETFATGAKHISKTLTAV